MAKLQFGFMGLLFVIACGGKQPDGSHLTQLTGGSESNGGTGQITLPGAGGNTIAGAGGLMGSGGNSAFQLHECPSVPDASCPTKALDYYTSGSMLPSALQGVTEVSGSVKIGSVEEIAALSCLQTVGGNLDIDFFSADASGPISLWPLRNLRTTGGGVSISPWSVELWVDCALKNLQSVGEQYLTGGAVEVSAGVRGELDLSRIQKVTHIRIENSELTKVTLPSNVALVMGQLFFNANQQLSSVDGFQGITLTQSSIRVSGALSLSIVNNPKFSTCRANELKAIFVAAGFVETTMALSGNLADCP